MMPQITPSVYSAGYQGRRLDEFVALLADAAVSAVIDVRETAWSQKPGFSRTQLERAFSEAGIEYVHARFAGNPRHIRRAAETHIETLQGFDRHVAENPGVVEQLDELLNEVFSQGGRPCLMCYERHPDDCHRSLLLRWWLAMGAEAEVVHLGPEGAPRFIEGQIASVAEGALRLA